MSEAKHTPGPWLWINDNYLESTRGETVLEVGDDGRDWGLHSCLIRHNSDDATAAANKSLIAAAPELLEAAEAVNTSAVGISHLVGGNEYAISGAAMRRLLAAIRKAQGESA